MSRIDVTPESPAVAESVAIEVFDENGVSYDARNRSNEAAVRINRRLGGKQFLQFATPGEHVVSIAVMRRTGNKWSREEDRRTVVVGAPSMSMASRGARGGAGFPLLQAHEVTTAPFEMSFSLTPLVDGVHRAEIPATFDDGDRAIVLRRRGTALRTARTGRTAAAPAADARTTYEWDFGDGETAQTTTPHVRHDFERRLDPAREQQNFHVRVSVSNSAEGRMHVTRTLSVVNGYAICRRLGTIVVRTVEHPKPRVVDGGLELRFALSNVENLPLAFQSMRVHPFRPHEQRNHLHSIEPLPAHIELGPKETKAVAVTLPGGHVPTDAASVTIYLLGDDIEVEGIPTRVRADATFELPLRAAQGENGRSRRSAVAAPRVRVLHTTTTDAFLAAPQVPSGETEEPDMKPSALVAGDVLAASGEGASRSGSGFPVMPPDGEECVPGTGPSQDGRFCMYTLEQREVTFPSRFVNAQKGDLVLTAGGDGITGSLLRRVTPPQYYSHVGIISRDPRQVNGTVDEQEVTHATASVERLKDPTFWVGSLAGRPFPTQGGREYALKYMWPGVITQTIDNAINGENMDDPETGTTYCIGGFRSVSNVVEQAGRWEIVSPLVVKPDPAVETPAIRSRLHEVADEARAFTGRGHYRLYGFSNPGDLDRPAPAGTGWAEGTQGMVCSSLVWEMARRRGVHLEGELEGEDIAAGAVVDPDSVDGVYAYDEAERVAAAEFVTEYLKGLVLNEAGPFRSHPAVVDAADVVANQVANTFTVDDASLDGAQHDRWRTPGTGAAVSPENLLFWDPPERGGLYGYVAPAVLRPKRDEVVPVYRWRSVEGRGDLEGIVTRKGVPAGGAVVQIGRGLASTTTDDAGRYRFEALAVGDYEIVAWKDADGVHWRVEDQAVVVVSRNRHDLDLHPPDRKLAMLGRVRLNGFGTGPEGSDQELPENASISLGESRPEHEQRFLVAFEPSAQLKLTVAAHRKPDASIDVRLKYELTYGGLREPMEGTKRVVVPPDSAVYVSRWGERRGAIGELRIDLDLANQDA